jgi:dienelactone hydrolase
MGGGLAYLTGIDPRVKGIISFYGTRADQPFYQNQSNLDNLAKARTNDDDLKVLSFFGGQDSSTPEQYQTLIQTTLQTANIDYTGIIYPEADHAFMNHRRQDRFNPEAKEKAILEIDIFLKRLV